MTITAKNITKTGYFQNGFVRPLWVTDTLSQFGITWTFTNPVQCGEFCNGDFWATNYGSGVEISSISPIWDSITNGTVVNIPITANGGDQGWDTRAPLLGFSATLNIADNLPYTVSVDTSIVSSIGMVTPDTNVATDILAILTVIAAIPDHGAFRPPYTGTNKTVIANEAGIDYSVMPSLSQAGLEAIPEMATVSGWFEKPWMEFVIGYTSRGSHASGNQPDYGREIAHLTGQGLVSLCLDYTDREKRDLMVRLTQYGLDIYGSAVNGMSWPDDGGHNQGRKAVLLMASKVLGNSSMLAYCDAATNFIFQEDRQTFYVTQADVDDCLNKDAGNICYVAGDIGIPEWGEKHTDSDNRDDALWAAPYRVNNGSSQSGSIAMVIAAGWETDWNWPVLFDYNRTRMMPTEYPNRAGGITGNAMPSFPASFWNAHIGALE